MKSILQGAVGGLVVFLLMFSAVGFRGGEITLDTIISSGIDTDGTVATITLSEDSFDCTFKNDDATNAITLTINGDADTIQLNAGEAYNTQSGDIPIVVDSFSSVPVAGTPDLRWWCWGQ